MAEARTTGHRPGAVSRQRGGLLINLLLTVLVGAALLFAVDYVLQPDRLPVRRISFIGQFDHVPRETLQEIAAPYIGRNLLALDLEVLERAITEVPWVAEVSVSRRWPDALQVTFREQQLVARWNEHEWVTSEGKVVSVPQPAATDLPRWHGPEGSQELVEARYRQFREILAGMGLKTEAVHYTSRGAWRLVVSGGRYPGELTIKLGRRDMYQRLVRFGLAYEQYLASMERRLESVDLRYPNGFALRWQDMTNDNGAKAG